MLDKNLGELITALDPMKHLIIFDTNGWFFNDEKARWFADLGGTKLRSLSTVLSKKSMTVGEKRATRGNKRF